jgi:DNA-binding transcriptional LysR family regulator
MELRHLRYFVAVAEELHFRRAAERLHVAQPAVSEQIRKLEAELGVLLLNRTHRSVSLTDAGGAMLEEARRVLRQAEIAQHVARETQHRGQHRLRVGTLPDAFPPALSRALARAARTTPIDLVLETGSTTPLVEDVRAGRLDLAVVCLPAAVRGLRATPFAREETVAALPTLHRLATSDTVTVDHLADASLLTLPRSVNPAFHDGLVAALRQTSFASSLQQTSEARPEQALLAVAIGHGIALLPASVAERYSMPGVTFRPLAEPMPVCEVALVSGREPTAAAKQFESLLCGATRLAPAPAEPALRLAA